MIIESILLHVNEVVFSSLTWAR